MELIDRTSTVANPAYDQGADVDADVPHTQAVHFDRCSADLIHFAFVYL